MTNDEIPRNDQIRMTKAATPQLRAIGRLGFGFLSSFVIRHSSFNDLCKTGLWSRCALWIVCLSLLATSPTTRAGEILIGTRPGEWQVEHWLNSGPLKLAELKGRVVLVRWWTAPDCRYCRASAPALNEFYRDYHRRGLEVIGFYHHKSDEQLRVEDVKKYAKSFGFKFPVAIDPDWRTLKQWWLDTGKRDWTSVSFLIDRHGVIRHIHPGGQYVKGDKAWAEMKGRIEELLAEK